MNNKEAAEKKWQDVKKWASAEEEKVTQKFKSENRFIGGLDTNSEAYKYIYEEMRQRIEEIQDKYRE